MPRPRKTPRQIFGFSLDPAVKRQAALVAERQCRSLSNLIESLLRAEVARHTARSTAVKAVMADTAELELA
jgi:predicted transcriptional regulator